MLIRLMSQFFVDLRGLERKCLDRIILLSIWFARTGRKFLPYTSITLGQLVSRAEQILKLYWLLQMFLWDPFADI